MTKTRSTKSALIASILAICLCFTMLVGTTFAWFTDSVTSSSNVIMAGNLDIVVEYTLDGENWNDLDGANDLFKKGAWEPGHTEVVALRIKNNGNLALKYTANMNIVNEKIGTNKDGADIVLSDILTVGTLVQGANQIGDIAVELAFTNENMYKGTTAFKASNVLVENQELLPGDAHYVIIKVDMAETVGDEANAKDKDSVPSIEFGINVLAAQLAYESDSFGNQYDAGAQYPSSVDAWDGTADTTWYNDTDTEFTLSTAEQLAGLADLVDSGNTFAGKTIKLSSDLDLYCEGENGEPISFDPIGYGYDVVFKGTFDGQGHTIFNLYQNGWALGLDYSTEGGGLFASVVDATIKNVAIDGAEIVMECIDMGVLVGYSYGNCTYENISVSNSTIANYQRYTGGVVGEVNGTQTFKNVDVASNVVVSSLWGDFDCSLGGIVGGKWGDATLTFEDCDVACELNTYNDVTSSYQWYAYRRAGMLIGNSEETVTAEGRTSATASYLTATNCTVTYGDWANYTYCEFAGTSWPYVRVQAGNACGQSAPYSNPRYGVATDANGNKAVDDNHVHNDGEDHNILLVFDQLFGGGQGVYGTATHPGVTVIYK